MALNSRRSSAPGAFVRRRRRGFSVAIMLLSAMVLLGLMALALDMAMVTLTAQQIQAGVDSAALAGVAEHFDRSLLCPDYVDLDLPLGVLPRPASAEDLAAYENSSVQARAQNFVALNEAQGQPLSLESNPSNDASGEIVLLTIDDPTSAYPEATQWPLAGHANGVQVTVPRTTAHGNPLNLWIAKSLGLPNIDISPAARAAFDQRIYGFQPLDHISVPALPILTEVTTWPSPELGNCLAADPMSNDLYAVAPATGAVADGADGFPEFTIRIRQSQTEGNAHLIPLLPVTDEPAFHEQVLVQTAVGLYDADLDDVELGGVLALDSGDAPRDLTRVAPAPDATFLNNLAAALEAIKGQKRVWPIGEIISVGGVPVMTRITNFAAGRVVHVSIDAGADVDDTGDDSLLITVQPTLLQTSTALVRTGTPANKWLGKVMLIR